MLPNTLQNFQSHWKRGKFVRVHKRLWIHDNKVEYEALDGILEQGGKISKKAGETWIKYGV